MENLGFIIGSVVLIILLIYAQKITNKQQKKRRELEQNKDSEPSGDEILQNILDDQDQTAKIQEHQYKQLRKARELASKGQVEEAISIAEKIMYGEEELLMRGRTWPFILSDIYLKQKMYDKCWEYLNHISLIYPNMQGKIDEVRVKILKKEGRHLDAMEKKMSAILHKYSTLPSPPTKEQISKTLTPFIQRAELDHKKGELLDLVSKHLKSKYFDYGAFRKEIKLLIK